MKGHNFKHMKTPYLLITFLTALLATANGQDYQHAVKIKPFGELCISYKRITGFEKGYEVMLSDLENGYSVTGLMVHHTPVLPRKSSKWFFTYGYGAHTGLFHQYEVYNPFRPFDPPREINRRYVALGLDGSAGVEYRMLRHPFLFSWDVNPNIEFLGPDVFRVNIYSNLGVAFVF